MWTTILAVWCGLVAGRLIERFLARKDEAKCDELAKMIENGYWMPNDCGMAAAGE